MHTYILSETPLLHSQTNKIHDIRVGERERVCVVCVCAMYVYACHTLSWLILNNVSTHYNLMENISCAFYVSRSRSRARACTLSVLISPTIHPPAPSSFSLSFSLSLPLSLSLLAWTQHKQTRCLCIAEGASGAALSAPACVCGLSIQSFVCVCASACGFVRKCACVCERAYLMHKVCGIDCDCFSTCTGSDCCMRFGNDKNT